MERVDKPTITTYCMQVWYPLLTLALGFLFCLVIIVLAYFTYQTAVGNIDFCTLWTDIPGRLVILMICYYIAGICGILPFPEGCRLNCLPKPFLLYRLESWRNLVRSVYLLLFSYIIERFFVTVRNRSETSPLRGGEERFYERSPVLGERSEPAPIADTGAAGEISEPVPIVNESESENSEPTPVVNCNTSEAISESTLIVDTSTQMLGYVVQPNEIAGDMEISKSSDDFMSFDSPIGGHIVPMVKGKSSKKPYIPDSSISNSTSSDEPDVDPRNLDEKISAVVSNSSGAEKDEAKVMFEQREDKDTPPRTPDVDIPLPNYPRFPWSLLKERGNSLLAKFLHRRNLRLDRNEAEKYTRKQMVEQEGEKDPKSQSDKETNNEWLTDSDEFDPIVNRPLRLPPLRQRRTRFRGLTTPGNLRREHRVRRHKKAASDVPLLTQGSCIVSLGMHEPGEKLEKSKSKDEVTKCCDVSPNFQFKFDRVKTMLMRIGQNRQIDFETSTASTSRQIEDLEAGRTADTDDTNINLPKVTETRIPTLYSEKTDFVATSADKSKEKKDSYFENV